MSKKWLALALKFLVSGFLIWFLLSNIDLGAAKVRLLEIDPAMLAGAALVFFVQTFIGGFRWAAVLTAIGKPLGFLKSYQLFYIGAFFNQTLPSSVGGDAVRMYKAYRHGLGLRAAVNGVVLERVVTVVALVVMVDATQPWFAPRVDDATMAVASRAVDDGCVASAESPDIDLREIVAVDEQSREGECVGVGDGLHRAFLGDRET